MAVPKRKLSKARRDMRRAQWMKTEAPTTNPCPNCGEPRLSHRACPHCGKYGTPQNSIDILKVKSPENAPASS